MKIIFLFIAILCLSNCGKPKTVLICGDHICINKNEARQYFEENLSIEVKIINKETSKDIDLVELNLKKNQDGQKEVSIYSKNNTNEKLKTLSNQEIIKIRENIKAKNTKKKLIKKTKVNKDEIKLNEVERKKIKIIRKDINKHTNDVVDVCTILEKCSIDEISKYLLKQGKKKNFPDITMRK
jgi:hypothetical protein